MLRDLLVAVVGFGAGCGVTAVGLRGRRVPASGGARAELSASLQESVTAFGEELHALTVGPEETGGNPQVLEEYRLALSAYDRAAAAGDESVALAALRDGRAALIRMAARRDGRPVPIDALPPLAAGRMDSTPLDVPVGATGERFLTVGGGANTVEILIDRPEPGRAAIVEVVSHGGGIMAVAPVVRTEDETNTEGDLLRGYRDPFQGRALLWPKPTHLRIESSDKEQRWSVRIRPMTAAAPLGSEWSGKDAHEVLFYDGGPALVTVQARSEGFWSVMFYCECLRDWECGCRSPRWPDEMPGEPRRVHGWNDGRRTLRLPRPGYLVLDAPEYDHEWYLTVEPFPETPKPPRKPGSTKRRPSP